MKKILVKFLVYFHYWSIKQDKILISKKIFKIPFGNLKLLL